MSDKESKIILITEVLSSRERKQKELLYYKQKRDQLEAKISLLQREIDLTNMILSMIEKEKIEEIKHD